MKDPVGMKLRRLPNGNLLIPVAVELGDILGDMLVEITPDDPRYADWEPFLGTVWEEPLSEEARARFLAEQQVTTRSS
jgi:hypothetical protein